MERRVGGGEGEDPQRVPLRLSNLLVSCPGQSPFCQPRRWSAHTFGIACPVSTVVVEDGVGGTTAAACSSFVVRGVRWGARRAQAPERGARAAAEPRLSQRRKSSPMHLSPLFGISGT